MVDETADLEAAARGIVAGASFDNNIICTCEKEIVVVSAVADKFKKALKEQATHELNAGELRALEKVLITETLRYCHGDKGLAASLLGITARTIYRREAEWSQDGRGNSEGLDTDET